MAASAIYEYEITAVVWRWWSWSAERVKEFLTNTNGFCERDSACQVTHVEEAGTAAEARWRITLQVKCSTGIPDRFAEAFSERLRGSTLLGVLSATKPRRAPQ
ncbi:unnamed protein product [Amoebophrya sp. A120]|nr:unnamed protein product [Amoebophrya sp. A120]|eukprot:GSA120T00003746001.1